MTAGLQPGNFIIIAARPSMGKTTLVLNMAQNIAVEHKRPVAIFSLEMPAQDIVMRMLSAESPNRFWTAPNWELQRRLLAPVNRSSRQTV